MCGCYIFIFFTGKKDDEMDPMDPSAYSDAPRYVLTASRLSPPEPVKGGNYYKLVCDLSPDENIFLIYTQIHSNVHKIQLPSVQMDV